MRPGLDPGSAGPLLVGRKSNRYVVTRQGGGGGGGNMILRRVDMEEEAPWLEKVAFPIFFFFFWNCHIPTNIASVSLVMGCS